MGWSYYIKDILIAVGIFIGIFILPLFEIGENLSSLVSATSTVFAIVAGFFIADAMSNYLRLQTLIAEENAALMSLANDVKKVDAKGAIAVHQAIDDYMIAQLSSDTLRNVFLTEKEVDNIKASIDALRVEQEDSEFFDHVLSMSEIIYTCRQENALASKNNLTIGHWLTLSILALLVAISVLAMRDGTFIMNSVTALMIVGVYAVLAILREMDNNHLLEIKLSYENPREVFHALQRPPFYPYFSSPKTRTANEKGEYRLGKKEGGFELMKSQ